MNTLFQMLIYSLTTLSILEFFNFALLGEKPIQIALIVFQSLDNFVYDRTEGRTSMTLAVTFMKQKNGTCQEKRQWNHNFWILSHFKPKRFGMIFEQYKYDISDPKGLGHSVAFVQVSLDWAERASGQFRSTLCYTIYP